MQLVEYVSKTSTFSINKFLEQGYTVVSVTPVHQCSGSASYGEWGAYFVLERKH